MNRTDELKTVVINTTNIKIDIFLDVTPCSLVETYQLSSLSGYGSKPDGQIRAQTQGYEES